MCNTYSLGRQGPDALRPFFQAERNETANMPELPGSYWSVRPPGITVKVLGVAISGRRD